MTTDPFASGKVLESGNSMPANLPPVTTVGGVGFKRGKTMLQQVAELADGGDPERGGKTGKRRKKQPDHNERTRKYWEAQGYQCDRVDGWMATGQMYRKKDFQGIWDMVATAPGKPTVFIQISSRAHFALHLRKMCGTEEAPDNKRPRIDNLRHMMACGFRCVMHLWDQPDGRLWRCEVRDITPEMVEQAVARRRK